MAGNSVQSCRGPSCCSRPPWLLATLADLESRMQALAGDSPDADKSADSFAERAENYYQRRPELLRLLQDLHSHYLHLADRYCQAALKQQQYQFHLLPSALDPADSDDPHTDSDAESSLSYQTTPVLKQLGTSSSAELLVVEIVAKEVERAFLADEVDALERRMAESGRKTDLQRSLLEVLESERLVLLTENARLGFRAEAAEEEGRELAEEAAFMRRRATELARCVVKMREDHRVCLLGRKIEDLQAQIYGLEKRNKECYEAMARREAEKRAVVREVCHQVERLKLENARLRVAAGKAGDRKMGGSRGGKWFGRLRKIDPMMAFCGARQEHNCW